MITRFRTPYRILQDAPSLFQSFRTPRRHRNASGRAVNQAIASGRSVMITRLWTPYRILQDAPSLLQSFRTPRRHHNPSGRAVNQAIASGRSVVITALQDAPSYPSGRSVIIEML